VLGSATGAVGEFSTDRFGSGIDGTVPYATVDDFQGLFAGPTRGACVVAVFAGGL
jgi:hypothetical protein